MRDQTAKENRPKAAWISHDLARNNELAYFLQTKRREAFIVRLANLAKRRVAEGISDYIIQERS